VETRRKNNLFLLGKKLISSHWVSHPGAFVEGFLFFVAGICISDMLFRTKKAGRERERLEREREETGAREQALVETQQRMDTFLSMASHELRTPLTIISFSAAVMQRLLREVCHTGNFDGDKLNRLQDLGQDVERQVSVLDRLVGDLLQASRLRAGKLEYQLVPCDLVPVIRRSIVEQQQLAPERSIRLLIAPDDEMVPVLADALRIGQVLTNYLVNALKYSGPEQPVEVSLQREQEGSLRVVVNDKGPGLSAEEQEHLWERFYQVERVKELSGSHRGLGLGLSISRAIIEHHGGCVGVESELGKGSAFWFTLPLVQ
jgi:signal transduction histidine kinase